MRSKQVVSTFFLLIIVLSLPLIVFVVVLLFSALLLRLRQGKRFILKAYYCLFKVRKLVGKEGFCRQIKFAF
jgi:hypothetical protein